MPVLFLLLHRSIVLRKYCLQMLLSRSIVNAVRSQTPPGRFLQKDSKTNQWFDVGDQRAQEKTSQALREGAPDIRKKVAEEQQQKQDTAVEPTQKSTTATGGVQTDEPKSGTQTPTLLGEEGDNKNGNSSSNENKVSSYATPGMSTGNAPNMPPNVPQPQQQMPMQAMGGGYHLSLIHI